MARALELARQGVALAHPNPMVGAVIVKDGKVVGEGFHQYDRRDHAETVALRKAGTHARGATLYVSMEPCNHVGRTGPCTKAIIAAGVKRVVAAMRDPNPVVQGRGFKELRRAQIHLTLGVREEEALRLNEGFAKWALTGRAFVTLKSALTLDGQISMRAGSATRITSPASRGEVMRLRHEADALLTGVGTILADNPRLTDRSGLPRRRKLLRAVVDSWLRIPLHSALVESADGDVLVFTTHATNPSRQRALERAGIEVFHARARNGRVDLREAIRELGKRQILNVLLEAGAELNGTAIQAGLVDKMVLFYAPKIMGTGGVPLAKIPSRWFPKAPALRNLTFKEIGPDFAIQGYFRDVYRNH
jgi:diaminohydroxyphosphoribosylaminopyrimidine deaminase/5-amino-6-(5-phosphoribosylamino)uracil reductase